MSAKSIKALFLSAAIFNWAVGLGLAFGARPLLGLIRVSPLPTEPLFLQFFAWLVVVFGIGYFWVSRDPFANTPIIRLGLLGKISVVLVALGCILAGAVSWQLILVAGVDGVYAVLFLRALKSLQG